MGYELKVFYHPQGEGSYDLSKTEESIKRLGKANDEPDDAKLAKEVLRQFSRRDVLVTDIEVLEFVRKPLKIKTAKNGCVVIRGKKYSLEDQEIRDADEESTSAALPAPSPSSVATPVQHTPASNKPVIKKPRVLRTEIYDPPRPEFARMYEKSGIVVGVKVEIIGEETSGGLENKTIYKVLTPKGTEMKIPAEFFVPDVQGGFIGGDFSMDDQKAASVPLDFGSGVAVEMPRLR